MAKFLKRPIITDIKYLLEHAIDNRFEAPPRKAWNRPKQKVDCDCGGRFGVNYTPTHLRSFKHKRWLEKNSNSFVYGAGLDEYVAYKKQIPYPIS